MARHRSNRGHRDSRRPHGPQVMVVEVVGLDDEGRPVARPVNWKGSGPSPLIEVHEHGGPGGALGIGDRALVRVRVTHGQAEGTVVRKLDVEAEVVLGIFDGANRVHSTMRVGVEDYWVHGADTMGAAKGDLVLIRILTRRRMERPRAKIVEVVGHEEGTRAFSLIAIRNNDIPLAFGDDVLAEAERAGAPSLDERVDLRDLALVTIDGEDARDFDDAVWAEEVPAGETDGPGWHIVVAIADVAGYVRPGSALDREALKRGNSTYFPDRVVPMLPEALSNGWCSLKPDEDRACLVAHIWIDGEGNVLRHRFERALMRSSARLTYREVQAAHDAGKGSVAKRVAPLYGAYRALYAARERRDTMDLDAPERYVTLGSDGRVLDIVPRERLDSHRLIEEFMIAANVAAAEKLEKLGQPCMYRVHDAPPDGKLEEFTEFVRTLGLKFARGNVVKPSLFNGLLKRAQAMGISDVMSQMVLRTQAQAEYSTTNIGHFGLALRRYCHFTSPIRRYADLLVHRALITGLKLGPGGFGASRPDIAPLGAIITACERRSVAAEREAMDRFVAAYYGAREGDIVAGRIAGAAKTGLFVRLNHSLADGFVPRRTLGRGHTFGKPGHPAHGGSGRGARRKGARGGVDYQLGDRVECRIVEADGVRGTLVLEILDHTPGHIDAGSTV